MKRQLFFIGICLISLFSLGSPITIEMGENKAGELKAEIAEQDRAEVTELVITGCINAVDFKFIRDELTSLEKLNIEEAMVVEYEGKEGTYRNSEEDVYYRENSIPVDAFTQHPALEEIIFPKELIAVEYAAFSSSRIKVADFSETKLERLDGGSSFYGCRDLTHVSLPATLKYIAAHTFYVTSSLFSFTCYIEDPDMIEEGVSGMFGINYKMEDGKYVYDENGQLIVESETGAPDCTLYVPEGAVERYSEAETWKLFGLVKEIESGVEPPEPGVNKLSIDMKDEPGKLSEKIEEKDLISLDSLILVGDINAVDFRFIRDNLINLSFLNIKETMIKEYEGTEGTYIDLWASDPTEPASYQYEENTLPYTAFYQGVEKLTKILFPLSLTAVDDMALMRHPEIKEVDLSVCEELETLGYLSFADCSNLSVVKLPASLTDLGQYAFQGLKNAEVTCYALNPETMGNAFGTFGIEYGGTEDEPVYEDSKELETCILLVPEPSIPLYRDAETWKLFGTIEKNDWVDIISQIQEEDWSYQTIKGGICIYSTSDRVIYIYSVHGILLEKAMIKQGENKILLSQGLYIIGGKKIWVP